MSTLERAIRRAASAFGVGLALQAIAGVALSADDYDVATHQLHLPTLTLGAATYSNVTVAVAGIISGPSGSTAGGNADVYDAGKRQLTVQTVNVGSTVYHNVVVRVSGPVTIGDASGVDQYDGQQLTIPFVQVGGTLRSNVVTAVGGVLQVAGGMPTGGPDTYSVQSGQLAIPAVLDVATHRVYTNVVVVPGKLFSAGGLYSTVHELVVHSFGGVGTSGGTDGAVPAGGLLLASDGNFYGLTNYGGDYNYGTVYRITPGGAESVLYAFSEDFLSKVNPDGANPVGTLIEGSDGYLYGNTGNGGQYLGGTVFRLMPNGPSVSPGAETLYSFLNQSPLDGAGPQCGLVAGPDGDFYGTTPSGGPDGAGTVFRVTPAGQESLLYDFTGTLNTMDGASTRGGLVLGQDGNFYGAATYSGPFAAHGGVFFRLTPGGTETLLHSFAGGTDGSWPFDTPVAASDGNF